MTTPKTAKKRVLRGGCLCGGVRYEVRGTCSVMTHCHCSMCRKAHGAAFATFTRVMKKDFRFSSGEQLLVRYRSSKNVDRVFCKQCGSSLLFVWLPFTNRIWVTAGTFDGDPGARADAHIFVDSKAPWFEINDDLEQYPKDRPVLPTPRARVKKSAPARRSPRARRASFE